MLLEPCPFIPAELDNLVGMLDPANIDSDELRNEQQFEEDFRCPAPCSFLRVGQTFSGLQRAAHSAGSQEQWGVSVRIQGFDPARGYLCGIMTASDVPLSSEPIVTFWEGELVDNVNHNFLTSKWNATKQTDMSHWNRFLGFRPLRRQVEKQCGRCGSLRHHPYIFMRLKEKMFVSRPEQCRLTIAGFYYVALNRATGAIDGYYFDRSTSPFQKLELQACGSTPTGINSATYEFC